MALRALHTLGVFVICGGLMVVGGEAIGDGHDFTLSGGAVEVSITYGTTTEATYTLGGAGDGTFDPVTLGSITSGFASNIFTLVADLTVANPALTLSGAFINTGASGEFQLNSGGAADLIEFTDTPLDQSIGLQNIDTITINGGTANTIRANDAAEGVTFNLTSGTITGGVTGTSMADSFVIGAGITINGTIDGGGGMDALSLASGFTPTSAVLFDNTTLVLTFSGGSLTLTLANIATANIDVGSLTLTMGTSLTFPGTTGADTFAISNNIITGSSQERLLITSIDGLGGTDELQLNANAVVASVAFSSDNPTGGAVHLQNVETITLDGGMVNGAIDVSGARAGVTFNLVSGRADGNISGSGQNDIFIVSGNITGNNPALDINGVIDGGGDAEIRIFRDIFRLDDGGVVRDIAFSASNPAAGDVHLQNIETIELRGGIVMGNITGSAGGGEIFVISGDLTSNSLNITGIINGGVGENRDTFGLARGGMVRDIAFTAGNPAAGDVHLQNIEVISLTGGTVMGSITGSAGNEIFAITGDLTSNVLNINGIDLNINGIIDGGTGNDVFSLGIVGVSGVTGVTGFSGFGVVRDIAFSASNPTPTAAAAGDVHLQNIENIGLFAGTVRNITGSSENERFFILGDLTSDDLNINGIIDGLGGTDELQLSDGATVASVAFSASAPTDGALHLQNVETITLNGGTVNGFIIASSATAAMTFNLISGQIGINLTTEVGGVFGSAFDDTFILEADIRIFGIISGGEGRDVLQYTGASGTAFVLPDGTELDPDVTNRVTTFQTADDFRACGFACNFESQSAPPTNNGLSGLSVQGIEVLNLSPALSLYGAMSDALMQFGQQTAAGLALADLNLATGRATSLASKDSPFTKGRIWAHKITHSGNGKGSIGLNLTGLTARADSDYNYEMSLTQHGFDAPVATTKLGAFNLRAVSHTMTGTIETNVAEANVSGYGAGVALMWRVHSLSAHITSLAGAYEVEAHTSPLNPRAVVSEVSEGSFSAINAVVSAGVADTRKLGHSLVLRTTADIVWQTLSLDDFNETGPDGIAINFDKATRFTARVGAGLEAEHWFSDVAFVHETSSGGTLSSGLSQDYRQDDGTAIEMKLGGKIADLATGLTLKAYAGLRTSLIGAATLEPSARFDLSWRF